MGVRSGALLFSTLLVPAAAAIAQVPDPGASAAAAVSTETTRDRSTDREIASLTARAIPGAGDLGRETEEAIQSVPGRTAPVPEGAASAPWWVANFQSTYVLQRKAGFHAPYTGPNSLTTDPETGYTLTATLFLGLRLWPGAEIYFDPEVIQSADISHLSGLGGLSNGENQKSGGPIPSLYRARAFLRQTIATGGEVIKVEPGQNQLGGQVASRRFVLTIGNFSWADVFEVNSFSHDPRTQFLNWAMMTYGAADYAADVRGYTWGLALEYYHEDWAFRFGRFAQPVESNGLTIDFDLWHHYGDTLEVEHAHTLWGQQGKIRVAGFHNYAKMGSFREALQYAVTHGGGVPSVADVRHDQSKFGFGVSLEQNLLPDIGIFARYSYNDGQTETYAFAEIERSLVAGVSVSGRLWHREGDTLGAAWAMNGISEEHREYLNAGGLGFLIGDGRLNYQPEQILEAYYSFKAFAALWVTVDAQHIVNPAYNADRGPVDIIGARFHVEF